MLKIGILTYIKEYANIGTNMQAYCTFMAIKAQFPDDHVEIIDYSAWNPEKRPSFYNMTIRTLLNDLTRIRKYEDFFRDDFVFSRERLVSSDCRKSIDFIKKQKYDAIFVGSDTLLELRGAEPDELNAYWLDETVKGAKFLISASSHNLTYEKLSAVQKEKIRRTIAGYSLLGVRDEATLRLLTHFTEPGEARLDIIPDPTFTYEIDYSYIEKYLSVNRISFNKPVVCFHLTREIKWATEVAELFRKEGYLVVSLRPAWYADMVLNDLSPFEQLGLYRYFDLVITHRFHDSIFSLKNLTPVIVFPEHVSDVTSYGENKNLTLFKSFGLEDNYIGSREELNPRVIFNMHRHTIDLVRGKRDLILTRLAYNKSRYEKFLKRAFGMLEGKLLAEESSLVL